MQISLTTKHCLKIRHKKVDILFGVVNSQVLKKTKADIIIKPYFNSNLQDNFFDTDGFIVNAPGEYEISGISVFGTKDFFILEAGEIRICFLNKLESLLKEKQLEEINRVDVLFLLLGEDYLDSNNAAGLVGQLQPSILLPVDQSKVDSFLQKLGIEDIRFEQKLKLERLDLPEEMEVVILGDKNGQYKNTPTQS